MTNQQILVLEKAIQKAIDGGWNTWPTFKVFNTQIYWMGGDTSLHDDTYTVIFDHSFAKALWGEKEVGAERHIQATGYKDMNLIEMVPAWEFHLQQMVIANDPIAYLGENI